MEDNKAKQDVRFEVNINLKFIISEDVKGNLSYTVDKSSAEEDVIAEQMLYLMNCINDVKENIQRKKDVFIEVPAKYETILDGLEDELATYRVIVESIYKQKML